jgi:hypothetical protein
MNRPDLARQSHGGFPDIIVVRDSNQPRGVLDAPLSKALTRAILGAVA